MNRAIKTCKITTIIVALMLVPAPRWAQAEWFAAPVGTMASSAPPLALLLAQRQPGINESDAYKPPPRGAPSSRVGGASRDLTMKRRIALVIGNGAYQNLPRLSNPADDARLMAATLQSVGFELIGGKAAVDLDRAGFERAIRDFGAALANASVALFYFAGHGVQLQGVNYLVPVAANPETAADVDFQLISANTVLKQMESVDSKLNIIILDACRNNPFGGRGLRDTSGGLAQMQAPRGTLISYATQPGNVAMDGATGHSPYTAALAEAIRRPGAPVLEVFNQVGLSVDRATAGRQQPWVAISPLEGTFYFVGPVTVNIAPPSTDSETVFWQTIAQSNNAADFGEYLSKFPKGQFVGLARNRLAALHAPPIPVVPSIPAPQTAAIPQPRPAPPSMERIRQFAAERSLPLPVDLRIIPPAADVGSNIAQFSGVWGGDNRWDGHGRQVLFVIESVERSGRAIAIYVDGPPNSYTYSQSPANWRRASGNIEGNTLSFEYAAGWKIKLSISNDQRMYAVIEPNPTLSPPFNGGRVWLSRIQ